MNYPRYIARNSGGDSHFSVANAKETRRSALAKYTAISHDTRVGNDDHLKYFLVSGISPEIRGMWKNSCIRPIWNLNLKKARNPTPEPDPGGHFN